MTRVELFSWLANESIGDFLFYYLFFVNTYECIIGRFLFFLGFLYINLCRYI